MGMFRLDDKGNKAMGPMKIAGIGLIGAGAGAGAAVVLDGNPVTGAVVGGAANVVYCQRYPSRC